MIDFTMYPYLSNEWVIKGTEEIPRLYNIYTNKVIKLNMDILKYIEVCDGTHSFSDICILFNESEQVVDKFYSQFISEKVIVQSKVSTLQKVEICIGKKEPWLKEVHIDITNNCNLRCRHCFWGENLGFEKNTPVEKWEELIDDMKMNGVGRVVFSGGEALTNADLLRVIRKCHENNIMVSSIFTNGTVNGKRTKEIIQYIVDNGLTTTFYISLDGCTSEQHDFIRGEGQFIKTIDFIKELLEERKKTGAKYKILINSLIHKKNWEDLVSWYEYLHQLGVDGWRFTTGRVSGFLKVNADEIKISTEECFSQYLVLIQHILKKYQKGESILYVNVENFFNGHMLETKKAYVFNEELSICDYKSQACSVDPKGNVQFCTGWQCVKYGNVFENGIANIWYSEKMRKMKEMKIREVTECRECKYLYLCGGGCRLECSNIYAKDEAICKSFSLFEEYIVPILKEVGIEFVI